MLETITISKDVSKASLAENTLLRYNTASEKTIQRLSKAKWEQVKEFIDSFSSFSSFSFSQNEKTKKVKVLDAGCGTGRNAVQFLEKDYCDVVHAFDFSDTMVQETQKNIETALLALQKELPQKEAKVAKIDVTSPDFFDQIDTHFFAAEPAAAPAAAPAASASLEKKKERKRYDAIICCAVLSHIPTEEKRVTLVKNLLALLNPGGKLFITGWASSAAFSFSFEKEKKEKIEKEDVAVQKLRVFSEKECWVRLDGELWYYNLFSEESFYSVLRKSLFGDQYILQDVVYCKHNFHAIISRRF